MATKPKRSKRPKEKLDELSKELIVSTVFLAIFAAITGIAIIAIIIKLVTEVTQ